MLARSVIILLMRVLILHPLVIKWNQKFWKIQNTNRVVSCLGEQLRAYWFLVSKHKFFFFFTIVQAICVYFSFWFFYRQSLIQRRECSPGDLVDTDDLAMLNQRMKWFLAISSFLMGLTEGQHRYMQALPSLWPQMNMVNILNVELFISGFIIKCKNFILKWPLAIDLIGKARQPYITVKLIKCIYFRCY